MERQISVKIQVLARRKRRSSTELDLIGKTVLITGAAKRVGRSIACELHAAGANVVVHYRSAVAEAEAIVADFNQLRLGSAMCQQADLLDLDALSFLVATTVERFGGLDALVNNASSFYATPLAEIDQMAWDDLVGTN